MPENKLYQPQPIAGIPVRYDKLLQPGTVRLMDKDKPTVYIVADSQETMRVLLHAANHQARQKPATSVITRQDFVPKLQHAYRDGTPCSHPGCLQHLSHPCEGCGRIGGRYTDVAASAVTTTHEKK